MKIMANRGPLTVSSSARGSLFLIAMASLHSHEVNGMAYESWKRLEVWNQITTFFEFFQVWFYLCAPPNLVIFCCNCTLYTTDWIRVAIVISIFANYDLWSWFDFHEILSKIGQNQSFCAHLCLARIDSLASCIWDLKCAQDLEVWMIWIFHDLFWFNLI